MRLQSPWVPRLADIEGSTADRLVLALADDIIEGRLQAGDRLPAHRDLAWKLGVGLGSVTKAYGILERRGLTRSVKGRGTFVTILQAQGGREIDLSSNTPPPMLNDRLLARTLAVIAKKIDADQLNLYAPPTGHPEHRRILSRWLATLGVPTDASRLVLTGNARQAIALAFNLACGPQGVILTEQLTYPGAIALARLNGYRMRGVDIDEEGIIPAALVRALASEQGPHKTVYLTPTLHNPSTATMGVVRRKAIVEICRSHGATIIEDGVYHFAASDLPLLAALAPDITLHVNGLSKSLGPGLRIGVLSLPSGMMKAAADRVRDMPMEPAPLSCALVEEWLTKGVIASVQQDLGHEARRRSNLAASLLGTFGLVTGEGAFHVWLPARADIAADLVAAASAAGIRVTPPKAIMVDQGDHLTGIRLCLGDPSFNELTAALQAFAELLRHSQYAGVGKGY